MGKANISATCPECGYELPMIVEMTVELRHNDRGRVLVPSIYLIDVEGLHPGGYNIPHQCETPK